MKLSVVIILAVVLISAVSASPLVLKHVLKKVLKTHYKGRSGAPVVTELHYLPAPVVHQPYQSYQSYKPYGYGKHY